MPVGEWWEKLVMGLGYQPQPMLMLFLRGVN